MTTDFSIGPVSDREEGDLVVVFGVAESLFYHIAIQAGPYNVIRAPIHVIRYNDILPESIDVPSHSIVVLAESHPGFAPVIFEAQIVKIVREMKLFAAFRIAI